VGNPCQINACGNAIGDVLAELQGELFSLLFILRVREASCILDRFCAASDQITAKVTCAIRALYLAGP
jgi:hypothetical protein